MSGEVEAVMTNSARIERAAVDWAKDELSSPYYLTLSFERRLRVAFSDGAYWMIEEIKAGRIKVNVKGVPRD